MFSYSTRPKAIETTEYILLVMLHAILWIIPSLIVLAYIFSQHFTLTDWADLNQLSLFMVATLMPDISFFVHVATQLYFLVMFFVKGFSWAYFSFTLIYMTFSDFAELAAWIFGIEAV